MCPAIDAATAELPDPDRSDDEDSAAAAAVPAAAGTAAPAQSSGHLRAWLWPWGAADGALTPVPLGVRAALAACLLAVVLGAAGRAMRVAAAVGALHCLAAALHDWVRGARG